MPRWGYLLCVLLQLFINRPLACFWHWLSKKPFTNLMKGDLFTFCQFCRKMAERSTTFHFINPSQTSEEGECDTETWGLKKWITGGAKIYRLIISLKANPIYCSCVIKSVILLLLHFPVTRVEFLDVSGSVWAIWNLINGCVFVN